MVTKMKKQATLGHALIPMLFIIAALIFTMQFWGGDPHIPILMAAVVAAIVSVFGLGYTWKELEDGIIDTIKMSMQALLIVMIIGMIIGTWILGGIVPTMIYYGLKLLSPSIFLVATVLLCSVVSLATGSSWTTAGTVGIALVGVGIGLGMNPGLVAGAIVSGAYFGDKMSPLSDTTNLAPAMAGSTLFEHIRHMTYTTGPSLIISLIIYGIIGMKFANNDLDTSAINEILTGMEANFNISLVLFVAPLLVILMVIFKAPAIPGLMGGALLGALFAFIFQGADMSSIIEAMHYGYTSETGITVIDDLLSRGGLDSMMWTLSLILCAMSFGGVMEKSGMLEAIARSILKLAHGTGSLVLATIITIIGMNLMAGDQYLSIVIPGRMYKQIYQERGLHPKNLSRVLEDAGTLTSPLVPWNTCGIFMAGTLGVATLAYLPYAYLNLINPLVSIFYGFTGITMEKLPEAEAAAAA
ncbi:Na+/H+ antiporter NhaC [Acidaminobacter sp.]|uniref:Na+/H+ antiporter NhaC n=1 Tax=Acidaminobacter sp. TaxID=1872102 RepID=UPI00255E0027|nr:Na+/H+ antiporter NhaC [Acidaminobacter sp.]MDK9711183.1 Na+/H+ antiporter NhaC [Acidaminobacter sp.]